MRHYQFNLPTALRFHELIDEYGRMRRLEDTTPQRRGQQFNHFIAELLGNWGTDRVQVNVRGVGEIDVAFAVDGTRFLLEAKWEKEPVSFDPIAKLSRRITQRLSGTRGVFLSDVGTVAADRRGGSQIFGRRSLVHCGYGVLVTGRDVWRGGLGTSAPAGWRVAAAGLEHHATGPSAPLRGRHGRAHGSNTKATQVRV